MHPRDDVGGLSGQVVQRIGRYVAAHGQDPEALYAEFGLSSEALGATGSRVPYALVEAIGERAGSLTGQPNIGLQLGQAVVDAQGLDAGGLMLMASATIRRGLERVIRFQRYWGDGERMMLVPSESGHWVRFTHPHGVPGARRHTDECAAAEVVEGLRFLTHLDVRPTTVRFQHPPPADLREHHALFRAPLEFEAAHTEVLLDEETLELPMRHAHEIYGQVFEREVERVLASRPIARRLSAHVRTVVRAALSGPESALSHTATVLQTSQRTLQRRLRAEGTSFGAIVDGVRREMAQGYLARDVPIKDIARKLGYADPSAFHRAFKRWTGTSPEQSRRGPAPG